MVLEIPGGLFQQSDVRETATETAATKDSDFVVYTSEVTNLPNSKILAVSTGLDIGTNATQVYFSLEEASETNLGGATFDGDDFTVTAGDVTLKNKTSYYSVDPSQFHATNPDTDQCHLVNGRYMSTDMNSVTYYCPINLPHGAVITAGIIKGSISDETWTLAYNGQDGVSGGSVLFANLNSSDTATHTVNNNGRNYYILTGSLDTGDDLWGGTITYTTDYD